MAWPYIPARVRRIPWKDKALRGEHEATIEPARKLAAEALALEREVSGLVNEAYGLTPEEVALMWQTAPPRMPVAGPV